MHLLDHPLDHLRNPLSWLICLLCWLCPAAFCQDVTLPAIFSDHMVLQQGAPVHDWKSA